MSRFRWKIADPDSALANSLASELRIVPLLSRCLVNRGCADVTVASRYLEPRLAHLQDPFTLPNMETAVQRLLAAHAAQERFVIFGDYDVDGVTATALLTAFFRHFGWNPVYYLPHRLEEGYGLNADSVRKCVEKFQPTLLVAVDCGSTAHDVIRSLTGLGTDVLVLDHHQVSEPVPPACAVVNPQLGTDPDSKNLCSVALAFKLAHALLKKCRALGWANAQEFDLRPYLDLVALGTIADIVPLRGENRILASAGLERLRGTTRPGLIALKKAAVLHGAIGCREVGFQLGPRLNAAGRLETAMDALELLLTQEPSRAEALAGALEQQNRERQEIEKRIADEVIEAVRARFNAERDYAIVEGRAEWHIGVVGIVASRVLREFHRPAIILGGDGSEFWRGSGRSIPGFDLAAGLRHCSDLLVKSGGHAMAAGLSMAESKLEELRTRLNELVRTTIPRGALQPELDLDGEVNLSDLNFHSLRALGRLDPIGHGNAGPQFVARGLRLRGEMRSVGPAQQHLRFTVTDGCTSHQALWWNAPQPVSLPGQFDLAFTPELNEFNGTLGVQLKVIDLKSTT